MSFFGTSPETVRSLIELDRRDAVGGGEIDKQGKRGKLKMNQITKIMVSIAVITCVNVTEVQSLSFQLQTNTEVVQPTTTIRMVRRQEGRLLEAIEPTIIAQMVLQPGLQPE